MKRLGIFCFCDKDGIVDKYIEFLLNDIILNVDKLYIACNGEVNSEGLQTLQKYSDKIYVRENLGFDAGAYRDIILNYISYEELKEYDELLLFNNSFFGPVYPFKVVFDKMSSSNADFWGLINQGVKKPLSSTIDFYIKSCFIVIRKSMFLSKSFMKFWSELIDTAAFEIVFTERFVNWGFKCDTIVDIVAYEKENCFDSLNWTTVKSLDLIQNYYFPIIEKQTFTHTKMFNLNGKSVLNYLNTNTKYDTSLIWDYLIRTQNSQVVYKGLSLHYLLPTNFMQTLNINNLKIGVFIHLYYEEVVQECFSYIANFPLWVDVYITTSNKATYEKILKQSKNSNSIKKITLVSNKGRDIAALLLFHKSEIVKYDIFCFTHDKKSNKKALATAGDLFRFTIWENAIKNECVIANIIDVFKSNPKIGLLAPPYPRLGETKTRYEYWWGDNYINTTKLAEMIGVSTEHINAEHQPLSLGTSFWARTSALKKLLEHPFSLDDFIEEPLPKDGTMSHAVERILPFVAQDAGYATGIVENIEFAEKRIVFMEQIIADNSIFPYLLNCVRQKSVSYIYGCGKIATMLTNSILNEKLSIEGFIVTNYKNNPKEFMGYPVYTIDNVDLKKNTGIIIALGSNNTKEVIRELNKRGITNYIKMSDY